MKGMLRALVAYSVLMAAPAGAGTHSAIYLAAWSDACEYTVMPCEGIQPPVVGFVPLLVPWGAMGAYSPSWDSEVVWMDVNLIGRLDNPASFDLYAYSVLMHEMVHYIDHKANGVPLSTPAQVCLSERMAFEAVNLWAVANEFPFMVTEGWKDYYEHCQ